MANNNSVNISNLHQHTSFRWFVLANVMIGTFMAVLDATIVNVGLTKMMAAFGVSVDKIEWVLTAYLLVFAVVRIVFIYFRFTSLQYFSKRKHADYIPGYTGCGSRIYYAGWYGNCYEGIPS
jgi:MFS family permease